MGLSRWTFRQLSTPLCVSCTRIRCTPLTDQRWSAPCTSTVASTEETTSSCRLLAWATGLGLAGLCPSIRQVWGGAPRCVHQKGSGWLEDDLLDVLWYQLVAGGSCQVARGVLGHSAVPNGQEVRCLAQWSTVDTWQLCCAKFDVQARQCCPPTF